MSATACGMSNGRPMLELADLQALYWNSERAERDLLPLALFKGPTSLGGIQAMWNLTQALQASGVETTSQAAEFTRSNPDAVHAAGLHPTKTDLNGGVGEKLWRLTNRLHSTPSVQKVAPDTYAFLREVMHQSRRMVFTLTPIERYNPRSWNAWRRPAKASPEAPMNPNWPFLRENTPVERIEGADLLVTVDLLIPKSLPKQIRDDVCQDVVLAILEGEITTEELKDRYQDYIKGVFRKFPIKYGNLSLDAPPPWDSSGRTLAETLVAA